MIISQKVSHNKLPLEIVLKILSFVPADIIKHWCKCCKGSKDYENLWRLLQDPSLPCYTSLRFNRVLTLPAVEEKVGENINNDPQRSLADILRSTFASETLVPVLHPFITKISFVDFTSGLDQIYQLKEKDKDYRNQFILNELREVLEVCGRNLEHIQCDTTGIFHETEECLNIIATKCPNLRFFQLMSFFYQKDPLVKSQGISKPASYEKWEKALRNLLKRCQYLRQIDLRWCYQKFEISSLVKMIKEYDGKFLRTVDLSHCAAFDRNSPNRTVPDRITIPGKGNQWILVNVRPVHM
jgi:hypothetical protein